MRCKMNFCLGFYFCLKMKSEVGAESVHATFLQQVNIAEPAVEFRECGKRQAFLVLENRRFSLFFGHILYIFSPTMYNVTM